MSKENSYTQILLRGTKRHRQSNYCYDNYLEKGLLYGAENAVGIFINVAHIGASGCWVCACVCRWNLTSSVNFEPILTRCNCSYGLWSNKSNHWVKHVDVSWSTDINQSISMNRFYPIEELIFIREFFAFP